MKISLIFSVLVLLVTQLQAQTATEKLLKKIPALPKDSCNITRSAAEEFRQKVSDLIDQTETDIQSLNQVVQQKSTGNEETAKAHAMQQLSQQYGLSQEDMKKMSGGKMSEADKKALANKILQQQANMSMGEVQNLSKMSEAGKKAYAEAYGTEMMATSQANPKKSTTTENAMNLQQLMTAQQAVMGKINANTQKIGRFYSSIESDPNLQKMYQNIDRWHSKLMSMSGVEAGQGRQMDSLALLIKKEQIRICDQYTPKYRSALRQHLTILKASLPDYQKLGEITAQLAKLQAGVDTPAENIEIGNLQAISGYLGNLREACKFKLYFPEEN